MDLSPAVSQIKGDLVENVNYSYEGVFNATVISVMVFGIK